MPHGPEPCGRCAEGYTLSRRYSRPAPKVLSISITGGQKFVDRNVGTSNGCCRAPRRSVRTMVFWEFGDGQVILKDAYWKIVK